MRAFCPVVRVRARRRSVSRSAGRCGHGVTTGCARARARPASRVPSPAVRLSFSVLRRKSACRSVTRSRVSLALGPKPSASLGPSAQVQTAVAAAVSRGARRPSAIVTRHTAGACDDLSPVQWYTFSHNAPCFRRAKPSESTHARPVSSVQWSTPRTHGRSVSRCSVLSGRSSAPSVRARAAGPTGRVSAGSVPRPESGGAQARRGAARARTRHR